MTILGYVLFFIVGTIGFLGGGFLMSTLACLLIEGFFRVHANIQSAKIIGAIAGGVGGGIGMYLVAFFAVEWFHCSGAFLAGAGAMQLLMLSWKVEGAKYGIPSSLLLYLPLSFRLP